MSILGAQVTAAAHAAAHVPEQATEELPNLITVLEHFFPKSHFVHFLLSWENLAFSFLVLGFIAIQSIRAARKKEFLPKGLQNRWELIMEGLAEFVTGILGPRGMEHVPFLGTMFIYILLQNWLGLIPFMNRLRITPRANQTKNKTKYTPVTYQPENFPNKPKIIA